MISFSSSGSFDRTERFLRRILQGDLYRSLDAQAQIGVAALSSATPIDSGETASSWTSEVQIGGGTCTIIWSNGAMAGGPLAIMLQYGHGTGTGGYVAGRDYINPAIKPVFDRIAETVWREVTSA